MTMTQALMETEVADGIATLWLNRRTGSTRSISRYLVRLRATLSVGTGP